MTPLAACQMMRKSLAEWRDGYNVERPTQGTLQSHINKLDEVIATQPHRASAFVRLFFLLLCDDIRELQIYWSNRDGGLVIRMTRGDWTVQHVFTPEVIAVATDQEAFFMTEIQPKIEQLLKQSKERSRDT